MENTGGGLTWTRHNISTTGSHSAQFADMVGNSNPEIVGSNWAATTAELWENTTAEPVAVISQPTDKAFWLAQNAPNPFRNSTNIAFNSPVEHPCELTIYDVAGRLVRKFYLQAGGQAVVTWDGRTDQGRKATPGVYFYKLEYDGKALARKLHLLR
jgi:hypothetical protein